MVHGIIGFSVTHVRGAVVRDGGGHGVRRLEGFVVRMDLDFVLVPDAEDVRDCKRRERRRTVPTFRGGGGTRDRDPSRSLRRSGRVFGWT